MRSFSEGPKSNDWSLEEKREGDGRQAQGRKGLVKIGRGGQDAATSQEDQDPWQTPEAGRQRDRASPGTFREGKVLADTLILNWERMHFCCLELRSLWSFYSSIRKLTHRESGKSHVTLSITQMCRIRCCVNQNRAGRLPGGGRPTYE